MSALHLPAGHVAGCRKAGSIIVGTFKVFPFKEAGPQGATQVLERVVTPPGAASWQGITTSLRSVYASRFMAYPLLVQCTAIHNVEGAEPTTQPSPATLEQWRSADAVCFDVDSTVSIEEGIDELAAFCGAGEAVAAWTARAMGGSVPFEEALAARLALFRPSSTTVSEYLSKNSPRLTPGIRDLVLALQSRGVDIYLVSGGFRQMIEPIAALLSIPKDRIFANKLLFQPDGQFSGVDLNEPTCRSGGKAEAIAKIKLEHGYNKLVMIGDGATDLEARKPGGADIFICYGGVQHREAVARKADWYVVTFEDLINNIR